MICTSLEWKQHYSQVEGNILMARRFQDDQRDTDEEGNKIQGYSIFTRQSSKIPVVPEAGKK